MSFVVALLVAGLAEYWFPVRGIPSKDVDWHSPAMRLWKARKERDQ